FRSSWKPWAIKFETRESSMMQATSPNRRQNRWRLALMALLVALVLATAGAQPAQAAPPRQDDAPAAGETEAETPDSAAQCQECHLDIASHWTGSAHAHA